MYRIALIPGDGIGPEVTAAAREVVDRTGVSVEWIECNAGACSPLTSASIVSTSFGSILRIIERMIISLSAMSCSRGARFLPSERKYIR